jgi:hypothetical protein
LVFALRMMDGLAQKKEQGEILALLC